MVTLTIKGRLPSLNEYTRACRGSKYTGAKMKKEAEELIGWHIKAQLKESHFDAPVRMAFRWYEPNGRRDLDNICFAKKFILDALVANGILDDDDWKHIKGFTDEFFIDSKDPRIEVDIDFDDDNLPF